MTGKKDAASMPAAARKDSHLDLARLVQSQSQQSTGLDSIRLPHDALPEGCPDTVRLGCRFLNHSLTAPLMIGAMTGGTKRADAINRALAETAMECGIAMGVGSQRASLEAGRSQRELRRIAPDVPLIGNLGAAQIAAQSGLDLARRAVDDLEADGLAIHLNILQEIVQPEGEDNWQGVAEAIAKAAETLPCPVIIKEVGNGISGRVAERLWGFGIRHVDVAGLGGTNWTRIEAKRRDSADAAVFDPFLDWGIPTADCLRQVSAMLPDMVLIGSGGIRHGLDAARALWLGADVVAAAGVFLHAAENDQGQISAKRVIATVDSWKKQLRLAVFLTGADSLPAFRKLATG